MWFWIFMLIMELLIPLSMVIFGRIFRKKAPSEINAVYGYRTSMSMKNKETWEFAHNYFGKVWYTCGLILLPVTIIAMLPVIGTSYDFIGLWGGLISAAQIFLMLGTIALTEKALKKAFDRNGNRKK